MKRKKNGQEKEKIEKKMIRKGRKKTKQERNRKTKKYIEGRERKY